MSDTQLAGIARDLAYALMRFAYERDGEARQDIARLHSDLCKAVRKEHEQSSEPPHDQAQ
jgi:hypothetical protein